MRGGETDVSRGLSHCTVETLHWLNCYCTLVLALRVNVYHSQSPVDSVTLSCRDENGQNKHVC